MVASVALKSRAKRGLAAIPGARRAEPPDFIEFCDPTLRDTAPSGPEWVHEIKFDGYRAQAHLAKSRVKIYSRNGHDWTEQFGAIAKNLRALRRDVVIDGEAGVIGARGIADYQALRRELGRTNSGRLVYHAFDLLYLDGYDLRGVAFVERKRLLSEILKDAPENINFVAHLEADGASVFAHACRLGVEGIVSKRKDSHYRSGRQESWIKLKCTKSDDYPIVAFVEKLGAKPRRIASLYIGREQDGKLLYAGKVRTGYSNKAAEEVREALDPLITNRSPLSVPAKKPKATWIEPVMRAEVEYSGITDDGILREAVFKGLREDLLPEVQAPRLVPAKKAEKPHVGVPRENILQLLPGVPTPTKDELADYWSRVWKKALPHLGHRPLKLVRHVHGTTFYHKGPLPPLPASVHKLLIQKREGGEGTRLWVDDLEGLLGLVEIGAVELHPWNATIEDFEHADRIVIDLDPGEGVGWDAVVEGALRMRDFMVTEGYDTWPKLTGGKGIHLMAPLEERMTHDRAHARARRLCRALAERHPKQYILSAQANRRGVMFLDYLRNGRGTTAIGTYSPRASNGFPIAAPVTWTDIEAGIPPGAFTIKSPFRAEHPKAKRPVRKRSR